MDDLTQVFLQEASDLLETLDDTLLECEENSDERQKFAALMRGLHTLKGSSATAGFQVVSELVHSLEDIVQRIMKDTLVATPAFFDHLAASLDAIRASLFQDAGSVNSDARLQQMTDRCSDWLEATEKKEAPAASGSNEIAYPFGEYDHLRLNALSAKGLSFFNLHYQIDDVTSSEDPRLEQIIDALRELGEMVATRPLLWDEDGIRDARSLDILVGSALSFDEFTEKARHSAFSEVSTSLFQRQEKRVVEETETIHLATDRALRVDMEKLDALLRLAGELVSAHGRFVDISSTIRRNLGDRETATSVAEASAQLAQLASSLQQAVLHARMVPCARIFRNLKGIARTLSRAEGHRIGFVARGSELEIDKGVVDFLSAPFGNYIRGLAATHSTRNYETDLHIEVTARASSGHIIFSVTATADADDAIIRDMETRIRSVGGRFEHRRDECGEEVSFIVPTTLAILSVMLFRTGNEIYGITLDDIRETVHLTADDIETIGNSRIAELRGRVLSLGDLHSFLGTPGPRPDSGYALVIRDGDRPFALLVDGLVGKQDIVIKPLPTRLTGIEILNGATILGNGCPAFLLNTSAIVEAFETQTTTAHHPAMKQDGLGARP